MRVFFAALLVATNINVSQAFLTRGSLCIRPIPSLDSVGSISCGRLPHSSISGQKSMIMEEPNAAQVQPLIQSRLTQDDTDIIPCQPLTKAAGPAPHTVCTAIAGLATSMAVTSQAVAAGFSEGISQGYLDPSNFNPVCPASDFFYRFLQSSAINVVGRESFVEYGPLIAGGLLRVRLELCVVESFFNEAVIPFIKQNGVNWVLPLHETVETFLAGTVFAIATTFILVGSTKILIVIATYTDFLIGLPFRLFGGFAYDRAMGKPVTLDIGLGPFKTRVIGPPENEEGQDERSFGDLGPVEIVSVVAFGTAKFAGQFIGVIRDGLDALDVFVGRYLVLWASLYIGLKFLHFKVFPDFP